MANAQRSLLVVAIAARAYVLAAKRAGYVVVAIDSFADKETLNAADNSIVVPANADGFDANALLSVIKSLDARQFIGMIYGSGFEAQPGLLDEIGQQMPVIGNAASVVKALKDKNVFFAALKGHDIAFPAVVGLQNLYETDGLNNSSAWLMKKSGGSGGAHIRYIKQKDALKVLPSAQQYLQAYVAGQPVSLLFLAYKNQNQQQNVTENIVVIGFNQQLLAATDTQPFRYGGAVSQAELPQKVQQKLIEAASKIALNFGLLGLNSLDVIVRDDEVFVLEVNPRLSATLDLYAEDYQKFYGIDLMDLHIQTCLSLVLKTTSLKARTLKAKKTIMQLQSQPRKKLAPKAQLVYYADKNYVLPPSFQWPDWTVDTPSLQQQTTNKVNKKFLEVSVGMPVCTILAEGANAEMALETANLRLTVLKMQLQKPSEVLM